MDYTSFLAKKSVIDPDTGLRQIPNLNPMLYPHQSDMVKWALRRGRAALFADCGIGKGPMQMEWANKQPHECIIAAPCDVCGTEDKSKSYDWANLTGDYDNPQDFKRMCRSCHWKYDKKHLNFKGAKGGKGKRGTSLLP